MKRTVLAAPQLATPCLLGLTRLASGGAPHSGREPLCRSGPNERRRHRHYG